MRHDAARVRRALDLAWKAPFVLASTLMVGSGAAQALGRTGVPPLAALAALGLAAVGTVLATATLWRPRRPRPVAALRAGTRSARSTFRSLTARTRKAAS